MDPLTQGVVGSVAAQQGVKKEHIVTASALGFFSAMTPDLDVFIRSATDPLLALEFHRQFTHSLFFIPIGGFICAFFFYFLFAKRRGLGFKQTYLFCTLGIATHGLIDACTTYGTLLFWPLSDMRVAWNTISIIDPIFTLPLLFMILYGALKKNTFVARVALFWIIFYFSFGLIQRERAESVGLELAKSRGHNPIKLEAKPSFANLLVWKTIYSVNSVYYVDAVRVGLSNKIYEGESIKKLDVAKDFPDLSPQSQQAKDIERFRWFSNDYLALSPYFPNRIIDMRYSMLPNQIRGMWGVEINPSASDTEHVAYVVDRDRNKYTTSILWSMIKGE